MRKYFIYYVLGILAIIVAWQLISYLITGHLAVTTNDPNASISVSRLAGDGSQKPVTSGKHGPLSLRLSPGHYAVTATSKAFAGSKVLSVQARKTARVSLNSSPSSDLEPVSPVDARNVIAGKNELRYVEAGSKILYELDSQNNLNVIDGDHYFDELKWADSSYGIGKTTDSKFYVINGVSVSQLSLPFSTNDNKRIVYAISASRQIFMSHGSDIYSVSGAGDFTKIYTSAAESPSLDVSKNRLAVFEPLGDLSPKTATPSVAVLDLSGKILARKSLEANYGKWSQDGQRLVIFGDKSGKIVDASLNTVADLPQVSDGINDTAWASNRLYYVSSNQLWGYDLTSQAGQIVANTPPGPVLTEISTSADNSYLYVSLAGSDQDKPQLARLGLRGQKVPGYVYQLPVILPDSSQPCALSFVNFTSPTVLGYADANPDQVCTAAAQTVFAPYGIDLTHFNLQFRQVVTKD